MKTLLIPTKSIGRALYTHLRNPSNADCKSSTKGSLAEVIFCKCGKSVRLSLKGTKIKQSDRSFAFAMYFAWVARHALKQVITDV